MAGQGKHPNSIANLKPRKKGDPALNPGGRPKKLLVTDIEERLLGTTLPDDAEGTMIRNRFHLGPNATWAHAWAASRIRRGIIDNAAMCDTKDRVEGRAMQRMEIATPENREIRIRVHYDSDDISPK